MTVERGKNRFRFRESIGGLATGLDSFRHARECVWIGWPGLVSETLHEDETKEVHARLREEYSCHPVFLSRREMDAYYEGFCNGTLWPLFTYFPQHVVYDDSWWAAYRRVNERFLDAVLEVVSAGDTLWIHDYHLMLLPKLAREALPGLRIGFFLHIPFPSFELFRLLPWRREILEGLMGADLVGFHTYDYVRHFQDSVRRLMGGEQTGDLITMDSHVLRADAFPIGIDFSHFAETAETPEVEREVARIRERVGRRTIILSLDRLDYTKGTLKRLEAFDLFLEENPRYKEKVTLVLVTVPSRTGVSAYAALKKRIDEVVGQINGRHGTIGWVPIWYLYRAVDSTTLVALYRAADVALVTPLRDGMNLIAKEFLATRTHGEGVLILSETAGAAEELGEALLVNPNDRGEVAAALRRALEMPLADQQQSNGIMQERLRRYDILRWAEDFLDRLADIRERQREYYAKRLTAEMRRSLLEAYREGQERLLLFDYDGTLTHFHRRPERARPDRTLLQLLREVAREPRNEVVLVSGRDRRTLEGWFGEEPVGLVAEHGAWTRVSGGRWRRFKSVRDDWKAEILPILEWYTDRTPGSSVEEKDFSLVWHYRGVDPEMGTLRARELMDTLHHHSYSGLGSRGNPGQEGGGGQEHRGGQG